MPANTCLQCSARFLHEDDSCETRFALLLSLDHSRREPWGSRHGQAFAAFALQHPATYVRSLDHAWMALYQIYIVGVDPSHVFSTLRAGADGAPSRLVSIPRRSAAQHSQPTMTIVDLAEFAADVYPTQLDAWCRASLASWGARVAQTP